MQRRAAAIYFVFFLVIAAGAWAFIGYAEDTQEPDFSLSGPTFENGTTHSIDGTEYTVPEVATVGGDMEATVTWTNESALHTGTIENGSIFELDGTEYDVVVANRSNVSTATLTEYYNVSQRLIDDEAVENELATQNGTDHVVYRENRTLVPLDEYLPERDVVELETGDTVPFEGNETTVRSISPEGITVGWIAPGTVEESIGAGSNVTLANGEQYFAQFPDGQSVKLVHSDQYGQYAETVDRQNYFGERLAGLWGVVIFAGIAALFLLATAYLPTRG